MRYGLIAENPLERLALASGQVPTPMLDGYGAAFGRALTVATEVGVFDALGNVINGTGPGSRWASGRLPG